MKRPLLGNFLVSSSSKNQARPVRPVKSFILEAANRVKIFRCPPRVRRNANVRMNPMKLHVFPAAIGFVLLALVQLSYGQAMGSSPAPAPSSDGTAIDQGVAYFLLLLALAVTYLIH
ncbi:hypothetical protein V6N12_052026 [Hibiscus sabdariffa]|uniref:Uncharacterized protein n=1 Tax=Hibiscus sabdariffa TaxID=183260 RepID=A0ABR2GH13_9ROSI